MSEFFREFESQSGKTIQVYMPYPVSPKSPLRAQMGCEEAGWARSTGTIDGLRFLPHGGWGPKKGRVHAVNIPEDVMRAIHEEWKRRCEANRLAWIERLSSETTHHTGVAYESPDGYGFREDSWVNHHTFRLVSEEELKDIQAYERTVCAVRLMSPLRPLSRDDHFRLILMNEDEIKVATIDTSGYANIQRYYRKAY